MHQPRRRARSGASALHSLGGPSALAALLVGLAACDESTAPAAESSLRFSEESVLFGEERGATIVVHNDGEIAVGPVEVAPGPVRRAGLVIPGTAVHATPAEIATLNAGDSAVVQLGVTGAEALQSGTYSSDLLARVQGATLASAPMTFAVAEPQQAVGSVEITDAPASGRQGDMLQFTAVVRDTLGALLEDAQVTWSTAPSGQGFFAAAGEFVPYATGAVSVVASAAGRADTVALDIEPRGLDGSFTVVGHQPLLHRFTSDFWIHGDHAYSGTWGFRLQPGNAVYSWDITGANPVLTDSVFVDAATVNDVKISADGSLAVVTQERSGGGTNAVTILDLSDPAHPVVAGEYRSDVTGPNWAGVHNTWIDGDHVYIVVDGTAPNRGLWILDISEPSDPQRVATFYGGSSFLHDVYVRDGLAFLSHWNAGLIIVDVGNGIRGGSPGNPVEVSRIQTFGGQTHNAWYWPETGYVFVGEEDFATPGILHVVDASDLENPVEVASYRIPKDTPHNFWLDEQRGILYMAWYTQGLHAIDVSGRLAGALELQGRTIAVAEYDTPAGCPGGAGLCTWAPQLHDGFVFVSDMNSGLWKLQPEF